jgi:DNA-binding transcriptional regulator YiaG
MDFKTLRTESGMNLTQFSKYFNIPYRTLQHWEHGTRKCPPYLIELMQYKLNKEKGQG